VLDPRTRSATGSGSGADDEHRTLPARCPFQVTRPVTRPGAAAAGAGRRRRAGRAGRRARRRAPWPAPWRWAGRGRRRRSRGPVRRPAGPAGRRCARGRRPGRRDAGTRVPDREQGFGVVVFDGDAESAAGGGVSAGVVQRFVTILPLHLSGDGAGAAAPGLCRLGVHQLPARIYWWTLYGAALAAVLVFRLGLPGWRSAYHRLRVLTVIPEAAGCGVGADQGPPARPAAARAGQFFLWRFLDGPGWTRANPYSLSAQPSRDQLRLTVQAVGDATAGCC
jgi:hypothetical protein